LANGVRLNDRYELEEFLGRTPYGESYRARDLASGQLVTIKALHPALVADAATMERLTREVQVAAQLDHKNIATTYGLFGAQVAGGTMAALAPEMMTSPESADARADLYSVGVILFELLTGRTPADSFERPSVAAPGVPPAVDPVVELCCKPSPDDRYADAQAL